MKIYKKSEKGQALVLIVLAIIGLIGITGLTIDGGIAYSDRRNAQNAADTAALAAGRAFIREEAWVTAGLTLAAANGYNDNSTTNFVEIYKPPTSGLYAGNDEYIQVIITSHVKTTFGRVLGITQMTNNVNAVARVVPTQYVNMFNGHAMVSLNASDCHAFTFQGTADTVITGSGIFVNSNCNGSGNQAAYFSQSGSADLYASSLCAVGGIVDNGAFEGAEYSGPANCPPFTDPASMYNYPIPSCPVNAVQSGNTLSPGNYSGTFPPSGVTSLQSGVYCVSGNFRMSGNDTLNGSNVIIYMINGDVRWQGGTITLSAPTSGPFDGLLLYLPYTNSNEITINGNVTHNLTGTILAPASHITINGTSGSTINGQIIGDTIDTGGTGQVTINYDANQNYEAQTPPYLELTQ